MAHSEACRAATASGTYVLKRPLVTDKQTTERASLGSMEGPRVWPSLALPLGSEARQRTMSHSP